MGISGGKLEDSETPQQCIERELLEELGLRATADQILTSSIYEYLGGSIELIAIKCSVEEFNISLAVHDDFKFLKLEALLDINLAPADVPIAKQLGELYG